MFEFTCLLRVRGLGGEREHCTGPLDGAIVALLTQLASTLDGSNVIFPKYQGN